MRDINLQTDLFMCPVVFDSDKQGADNKPMSVEDNEIHYTQNAVDMIREGCEVFCVDRLPSNLISAREAHEGVLHLRMINSPDGKQYIPLFAGFESMTSIFGKDIHIGVVSFADAYELCMNESNISGIVVAPGHVNKILTREALEAMKK